MHAKRYHECLQTRKHVYGVFNENQTFLYFFACVSLCTNVCCVNILGICIVYIPEMRLNRMIVVVASTILRGVYVWINH